MKIASILASAAALGLVGCASVPPPTGPATLTSASKPPYGSYVVDANGRALYILEGTRGGPGTNRCSDECLRIWPPLLASGPQVAGGRLNQSRIALVPGYGGPQVSYAGWPLYYYHHDRLPSDTTGQHVTDPWGTWHLLSPTGAPIRPAQ